MLPKENRITKNKEFDAVFKQGRSNYSKIVGIKTTPNDLGSVRMGILVGNKISKKATDRNKIKRRIREIFSSEIERLTTGQDFVIIALSGIMDADYDEIKRSLVSCLKKINSYK